MSEQPADPDLRRRRYFEDYKDTVDRHREGALFFEARAIDFASNAFKALTYLNGGGLIAIPTAVASGRKRNCSGQHIIRARRRNLSRQKGALKNTRTFQPLK